ncbi:MAG: hypothetical protein ACREIW_14030 [Chthoniobacterales bacterium]
MATQLLGPTLNAQIIVTPTPTPLTVGTRISNLLINVAIGSVTGLTRASIKHSSKWRGIKQGVAGGFLMSVGKQIAASSFDGSGFVGRQVSAVGVSLTASSGEQKMIFAFPLGPLSIEECEGSFDWRLNVAAFVEVAVFAASSKTRLDLPRSLSSGAPVFRDRRSTFGQVGDIYLTAITQLGTIRLSKGAFDPYTRQVNVIYHENVHILQDDYFEEAIALSAERVAIEQLPFGRHFLRHFDLGVLGPAVGGGFSALIPYRSRPWEREAYALTTESSLLADPCGALVRLVAGGAGE